jgi:hypothetical protein
VPAAPEPGRRQRLALEQPEPRSQGWALGAGIYGFVASGLALSLGIASEATRHDLTGAELGGVDTLFVAVSAPVVEAGAASTRRRTGAPGLYGARLTGWLSYAFSMLDAVAIFAYANIDAPRSPPGGWITSFTVLATASMLCMSADAIASSSQGARMTERASVRRPLVEVAPSLGVASGTASVGVVGAF